MAQLLKLGSDPTSTQIEEALGVACQAAAMSVEKEGTMDAVPLTEAVKERMKEGQATWPEWA